MELQENDGGAGQPSRYETLRQVSGVIATQADLNGVLESLARFLPAVVSFEFLGVVLHDPEHRHFRLHAFGGTLAGSKEIETEIPDADPATAAMLMDEQKPIILNDIEKETGYADIVGGRGNTGCGRWASSLSPRRDGGWACWPLGAPARRTTMPRI